MKFEEKFIKLRKEKGFSQEELAEKLNVTRQTISKWELGQTKPDMDKIKEISALFEISVENLINDSMEAEKGSKIENKKPRRAIIYVFGGLLVALIIALIVVICGGEKATEEDKPTNPISSFFETFFDIAEKGVEFNDKVMDKFDEESKENQEEMQQQFQETVNQMTQSFEKDAFNISFENKGGTRATIFVKSTLDAVNRSNKKNAEHIILVEYRGKQTSEENEIISIKNNLKDFEEYEVIIDYDENGYVNLVKIKDIEK
ncbi:MAG: helix-turn-helix transcriptional regulator [Clostridia bacterium]|nr:helix-turn-helix transcriptional regulator [Clostridia bacterium]